MEHNAVSVSSSLVAFSVRISPVTARVAGIQWRFKSFRCPSVSPDDGEDSSQKYLGSSKFFLSVFLQRRALIKKQGFLELKRIDRISVGKEDTGDKLREKFWLRPVVRLDSVVGSAPARRAGSSSSNADPGENFSFLCSV